MVSQFVIRYARRILIVTALLLPAIGYGASQVFSSTGNDIRQWLPASFQETRVYDWFVQQFGSEEMIIASWPGATSDGADVRAVVEGLRGATVSDTNSDAWFSRVITASEILEQLTEGMADLSMPAARKRLQGR